MGRSPFPRPPAVECPRRSRPALFLGLSLSSFIEPFVGIRQLFLLQWRVAAKVLEARFLEFFRTKGLQSFNLNSKLTINRRF